MSPICVNVGAALVIALTIFLMLCAVIREFDQVSGEPVLPRISQANSENHNDNRLP